MVEILYGPVGPLFLAGMRLVALAMGAALSVSELLRSKSATFWFLSAANVGGFALLLAELGYASPVGDSILPIRLAPLRTGSEVLFALIVCLGFLWSLAPRRRWFPPAVIGMCLTVLVGVVLIQVFWLHIGAERRAFGDWWPAQILRATEILILLGTALLIGCSLIAAKHLIATSLFAMAAGIALGGRLLTVALTPQGPVGDVLVLIGFLLLASAIFFNIVASNEQHAMARTWLQQRLADEQRAVLAGIMAAGIAHEIASPLTALAHHAKRAMTSSDQEKRQRSLELIIDEIWRVAGIAQSLTHFARPQTREIKLVELEPIITQLVELVEPQLRQRKVKVRIEKSEHPPPVQANPERLRQVFLNLLRNAWEASDDGGEIFVRLKAARGRARVEVCDNGKGIPAERLEHLFEPFFSDKGTEGSGLGLFISRELVLSYGGEIRVESQLGSGSTFIVELPAGK